MQCFNIFLDDSKQYDETTTANSKFLVELLKEEKILTSALSKIWENTDGCAEKYRCASALYLRIDRGISAPGNGKDVVDGINTIDKCYIYELMSNFQLPDRWE